MTTTVNDVKGETPGDTAPALAASGVTVRFGGLMALADVSMDVAPGSIAGLVGPNGAGKSTLLGVLSGLQRPNGGRVSLLGEDVTHASARARAQRGLARTFQQPELFLGLTVREPAGFLLDEPLSGLDMRASENLLDVFRRIVDEAERTLSLVIVEHDVAAVLSLSDTVFVLDFGERIAAGTPEQIRNDPAVQSAYLGDSESAGGNVAPSGPAEAAT